MGMYDEFIGTCPHCGGEFCSQTKLTACEMTEYRVGDAIKLLDQRLMLKDPCSTCEKDVVVVIKDRHVVSFEKDGTQVREGAWGSVEWVDVESYGPPRECSRCGLVKPSVHPCMVKS